MRSAFFCVLLASCAVHPTHVLELADAETDEQREDASNKARTYLRDGKADLEVRTAAALALGRMRLATPDNIDGLGGVLSDQTAAPKLRAAAAWALGELRADGALSALASALRTPMDGFVGQYVLEAIAKHDAFLARDQERVVGVVEALVYFAGNQSGRPPAIYDVLGERTRTLPVNVKVLERAIAAAAGRDPRSVAAMYNAAYELLERIERSKKEILAGSAAYQTQLHAAVEEVQHAMRIEDARTELLTTWYLGRLAELGDVSSPGADMLIGGERADLPKRATISPSLPLRFVAAWTLARLQLGAPGPRRALARDVLPHEIDPVVLRVLADLSNRSGDIDQLQKILGVQ